MDLSKFAKSIRVLTIIPIVVGVLSFIEIVLPNKSITTKVVSKHDSNRLKTGKTTYTIRFKNINDQFSPEIYNHLSVGDQVTLQVSPIHKQIKSVKSSQNEKVFENNTGENYAIYGFGIVFLLSGLAWFKKEKFTKQQANFLAFIILLGAIMGLRML